MNMAGSCSSCYVTTGSFSRSAINYNAGAQTVVSNIVVVGAVLVTLHFLMPLFYYTPNLILAAIIITAVIGLIYEAALKLWKLDTLDFVACLCLFFSVLFISVPLGLAVAVSWSFIFQSVSSEKCWKSGHSSLYWRIQSEVKASEAKVLLNNGEVLQRSRCGARQMPQRI